jgi:hypothetical protein
VPVAGVPDDGGSRYIEGIMLVSYRPLAAVLAALATCTVFVFVDFLFRYAAQ